MTEIDLNISDKKRLKSDIKISLVIGLLFSVVLVIIVGLVPGILFIIGKRPSKGFVSRGLYILALLFIPFLVISWTNLLKYIDLKKGKKYNFKTEDYEVLKEKDKAFILTKGDVKHKIKIDNLLIEFVKSPKPLVIEISKLSKFLLFISHDNKNLLDKLYNDEKHQAD